MSRRRKQDEQEDTLRRDVYEALKADGQIVPQTEAKVASAEAALAETSVELPAELRDAKKVFQQPATDGDLKTLHLPLEPDVDTSLRRAAREGGFLSPEIEDRMRRDRQDAEREDDNDHGQDSR
ncbi:MAG: hypothetical protein ACYS8X_13750 [Planctomycetota bacterium]|jgi:hypothetical protein